MARLDELTDESDLVAKYSHWGRLLDLLIMGSGLAVCTTQILSAARDRPKIDSSRLADYDTFDLLAISTLDMLQRIVLLAGPGFLFYLVCIIFGDLLAYHLLRRYRETIWRLETDHPEAAMDVYARMLSGKLWSGIRLARSIWVLRAARHVTQHPEYLAQLPIDEVKAVAGCFLHFSNKSLRQPDDQPLPALAKSANEVRARGESSVKYVASIAGIKQSTSCGAPDLSESPEERLRESAKPSWPRIFLVVVLVVLAAALAGLWQGDSRVWLLCMAAAHLLGLLLLLAVFAQHHKGFLKEQVFQAWRLRVESPRRYLELALLRPDSKTKLISSHRIGQEWIVKALLENPGLIEALEDSDLVKIRQVVKHVRASQSLPKELLQKARPLVGLGE